MPGTHEKTLGNTTCAHVMCGRKGTSAGKRDWGPGTGPCISTLRAMDIQQVLQLDAAAADAGTLRAALKAAQQALASTAPAASPAGCALRLRSDELAVQEQAGSAAAAAAAATVTSAPAAAAAALFTTWLPCCGERTSCASAQRPKRPTEVRWLPVLGKRGAPATVTPCLLELLAALLHFAGGRLPALVSAAPAAAAFAPLLLSCCCNRLASGEAQPGQM